MNRFRFFLPILAAAASTLGSSALGQTLANDAYTIAVDAKGSLTITKLLGGKEIFRPRFVVIRALKDPKMTMRYLAIPNVRYHAPSWPTEGKASRLAKANTAVEGGDGFDTAVQKGDTAGRTVDVFQSGEAEFIEATGARVEEGRVVWEFAPHPGFAFAAEVSLPEGTGTPKLTSTFTPAAAGWYSVGYVGAPAVSLAEAREIWQPLIWQEKRFPEESVLTPAGYCTLPATFAVRGETSVGVAADPSEMPFLPLPRWDNSLFAVGLRNENGAAQPMIFAPILGGPKSAMEAGAPYTFAARLYVGKGTCADAYEDLARSLYGFHDYRENAGASLNTTIENMIAYGLSDFSRFDRELKGCMYETDVPGAVKNVSSLHPLESAVVTDNEAIYRERALPILEYLLSREKFLFVLDRNMKIQSPSRLLHGPCAEASEFAAAYAYGNGQSPVLLGYARDLAEKKLQSKRADRWVQVLALYHATQDPALLQQAAAGADAYLAERMNEPETIFDEAEAGDFFFWTSYSPLWINLLDLYEQTREPRYLEAARKGARAFTQYVMMSPKIPDGNVTVNPGGKAPLYAYLKSKGGTQMSAPEESVPAWRVSEIGLTPESSPTVLSHRGIFMTNYAAWMMRLSELTGDQFLHDVARAAVVGRYQNFPGYHINTNRTTVYEKAGYPLRPHKELSYNSFHYNHIWPHVSLLIDYLVNDVFAKSQGAVDFPGRYSQGYGYLQSRIYGDRPGVFYGEKDVRLWMPRGLLSIADPQINYLSGRRGNTLFAALANQSAKDVETTVQLNPELVRFPADKPVAARVWIGNQPVDPVSVENGKATVRVPAGGITGLMIEGVEPQVVFQDRFGAETETAPALAPVTVKTGDARAMVLNFGPGLRNAFVYLRETDDTLASASLRYRDGAGGEWKTAADEKYPFEFSIPIPPDARGFEFVLETKGIDGKMTTSESVSLPLGPQPIPAP